MSFNVLHKTAQNDTGVVSIGAQVAGTTLTGPTFTSAVSQRGSLAAKVVLTIVTGALTLAPKWQASEDGTNWFDVANTAVAAITASGTVWLAGPGGSYRFLRIAILTAGATAAAGDNYRVGYNYDAPQFV